MQLTTHRMGVARALSAVVLVGLCAAAATVRADEASGTWSGAVELRGNYYWERSTRVLAPTVGARVEAPNGLRFSADYLVDSITSASVGAGLIADVRFTETRHDGRVGVGYEFDVGNDAHLTLDANGHISDEPDYKSKGGGLQATLALFERTTMFRLSANALHDEVGMILRGAQRSMGGRDLSNRGIVGDLDALALGVSWSQIVSPVLTTELGYDLGLLWGFQSNPYRQVSVGGVNMREAHPDERTRHTVYGRVAYYVATTHTSLQLILRGYADDWEIRSINPELRVFQDLGDALTLRLRYRYYQQSESSFYQPPGQYTAGAVLFTADPKMSAFHSNQLGAAVLLDMTFLDGTALDFARAFAFDFSFDYIWNTNRYGNAVLATVGLRAPF